MEIVVFEVWGHVASHSALGAGHHCPVVVYGVGLSGVASVWAGDGPQRCLGDLGATRALWACTLHMLGETNKERLFSQNITE